MACGSCLRGHRGSVCNHTDRQLFPVKAKGRPKGSTVPESVRSKRAKAKQDRANAGVKLTEKYCCNREECHCLHVDGQLIESGGCNCCGLGLAQQALPPLVAATNQDQPTSSDGREEPALPLKLSCTCPQPCRCASCPSRSAPQQSSDEASSSKMGAGSRPSTSNPSGVCSDCLPCVLEPSNEAGISEASDGARGRPVKSSCCSGNQADAGRPSSVGPPAFDFKAFHSNHLQDAAKRQWFSEQMTADGQPVRESADENAGAGTVEVPWGDPLPNESDDEWQRRLGFHHLTPAGVRIFDAAREFREEREAREVDNAESEAGDGTEEQHRSLPVKPAASAAAQSGEADNELAQLRARALQGIKRTAAPAAISTV